MRSTAWVDVPSIRNSKVASTESAKCRLPRRGRATWSREQHSQMGVSTAKGKYSPIRNPSSAPVCPAGSSTANPQPNMTPRYSRKTPSSCLGLKQNSARMPAPMLAKATSAISCRLLRSSRQCHRVSGSINHICGTVVLVTVISDVRPGTGRTQKASPRWSVGSSPSGTASSDRVERQSTSSGTSAGASKAKRQCPGPVCCQPVRVTPRVSCSWVRASSLTACGQRRLSRMHSPRIRLTSRAESRK